MVDAVLGGTWHIPRLPGEAVKLEEKGRSSGGAGYDVDELSKTFYGRQVLAGLGFTKRRRVLDQKEFDKFNALSGAET